MIRIPLPGEDTALLLSPRWGLLALVALLVPIALAAWLYRYELRLVSRSTAAFLLVIRLAALVSLLTVVCLQPVIARRWTEERSGTVIVAVDRSKSMDVPDPQRKSIEKLRLAQALKAGDEGQLDRWIKHFEGGAANEPEQKQALDELLGQVDGWTRSAIARKILLNDVGLLGKLSSRHPVELVGFARSVQPVSADMEDNHPHSERLFTDVGGPLSVVGRDSRVLGIVLLTDGQHNSGAAPILKARALADQKIPIYPIALGARRSPPDIAVRDVKAPANTFPDADSTIEARIRVTGLPAGDIRVELHQQGKPLKPEFIQKIRHDGGDRDYPARFQIKLTDVGTHKFDVKAVQESKLVSEISADNNSAPAITRVLRDKAKVLLIDAEPRWEYQYLATLLSRDKDIAADRVLFHQPRIGMIKDIALKALDFPLSKLPEAGADGDPLLTYECIVLGDVLPTELHSKDRVRLERYVKEAGGTLVLIAGKRGLPLAFLGSDAEEPDSFVKLLPISAPRLVAPEKGFKLELTKEGQAAAFLHLEPTIEENLRRWAELSPHYWGIAGKPKPGATVLARPSASPSDEGLIVEQNYGFGRVVYIGLDSTWRWRYRVGDAYHHRFWGQLIRWAAADKLWPAGNKYVRFGTRDPVYGEGKQIQIGARLSHEVALPKGKAVAHILRKSADGKEAAVADVPLVPSELQPRLLTGQVTDLAPGEYRVELDIPELKDKMTPDSANPGADGFTVLPPDSSELSDLTTNWSLLEALAGQTKGEVLTPETAHKLIELLESRIERIAHRSDKKVWQDAPTVWITLALLLSLLTLEWGVRKWVGLP